MPRLTISQRIQIKSLRLQGWSMRDIANHMQCNIKAVQRWSQRNFQNMNDKTRRCKSKFTLKFKKNILASMKRNNSLRKTANQYNISHSSVYKMVRRNAKNPAGLFPYKPKKSLRLTNVHRQKRLKWCSKFKPTNSTLKKLICCDEKPFELQSVPNVQNTRFWSNNSNVIEDQRLFLQDKHPTVVHMFAAINWYGKSAIKWFLEEKENKKGLNIFWCFIYIYYIVHLLFYFTFFLNKVILNAINFP
jgi:transposase